MSLHILASGSLIADPACRTGAKGEFATATIRTATDDGAILVSVIAFGDEAAQLLAHRQGSAVAIAGRATLRSWTGKDGETKCGLSLVAEQIASASASRRADAERRRGTRAAA